jgi:hypothetical protein
VGATTQVEVGRRVRHGQLTDHSSGPHAGTE